MSTAYETLGEVGDDDAIREALADARAGDFKDARSTLDDLLDDGGYDGEELLRETLRSRPCRLRVRRRRSGAGSTSSPARPTSSPTGSTTAPTSFTWGRGRTEIRPDLRDPVEA